MPIESNKPPDPLLDELCTLTKMTSADDIRDASLKETKVKVVMGKLRKPSRGIKISTPGSAGAGSILRRVRSAKVSGRARERLDRSPVDFRGGKRASAAPANDEISQVLSNIKAGNISHLKFDMGSSSNISDSLNKFDVMNKSINENDGSFIKVPLEKFSRNEQGSPVAKCCGFKTSLDHYGMDDDGNTRSGLSSLKDGIAITETGNLDGLGMAGSGISNEHTSMEDVVNTGVVHEN
nr:hypothetical protein [Tanacetum cinerariifolium]